jgi:putative oxidoreductase
MDGLTRYAPLPGRLLLALIFVLSGFSKIGGFAGTVGYIASKGLPLPELAAIGAIVLELGAGLMLALGWKARWAALALAAFTLVAALIFHNFWGAPPEAAQNQMIHFMKNLAMVGGLLYVAAFGSGALSIDGSRTPAA